MPDPPYHSSVNPDILSLIPPDAKTVLEIGCGDGSLCESYRRVNPGVEWEGIDCNKEALEVAQTKGVITCHVDLNESLPAGFQEEYDVLILGDVLEHLRDPWEALKWAGFWLKPGGQCIACIPNVQHYSIIREIMAGNFPYQDRYLFDRTHLRWFTKRSMHEMFEAAGLQVFEFVPRRWGNDGHAAFMHAMAGYIERAKLSEAEFREQTSAAQYVVRSLKPATVDWKGDPDQPDPDTGRFDVRGWHPTPVEPLRIHAVLGEITMDTPWTMDPVKMSESADREACCIAPRITDPLNFLRTIPGVRRSTSRRGAAIPGNPDILIHHRFRDVLTVDRWSERLSDSIVIAEIDDDPTSNAYLQGKTFDPRVFSAVHAVQCSTERVAETVRQWNPNVAVFDNQIAEIGPLKAKSATHPILFYGAQNRETDWKPLMPALNRVLADHQEVAVHVVHDRAFFDALEIPKLRKQFTPFCEYGSYRNILANCDIALLPLEPGRFNEHKSDIKFLEAAAEGVCVLASETVYAETILQGTADYSTRIGRLYDGPEWFETELRHMINEPEERQEEVADAYAYVRDHRMLKDHFRARYDWYMSLVARKAELDAELWERCPEMKGSLQGVTQ